MVPAATMEKHEENTAKREKKRKEEKRRGATSRGGREEKRLCFRTLMVPAAMYLFVSEIKSERQQQQSIQREAAPDQRAVYIYSPRCGKAEQRRKHLIHPLSHSTQKSNLNGNNIQQAGDKKRETAKEIESGYELLHKWTPFCEKLVVSRGLVEIVKKKND